MSESESRSVPPNGPVAPGRGGHLGVFLVVELADAARLASQDAAGTTRRWQRFVHRARQAIAPHQGRLLTALGWGLVLSFHHTRRALQAAADLHRLMGIANAEQPALPPLQLCAAIHAAPGGLGAPVPPEAALPRLTRLNAHAGAGDTVLSAAARESLAEGLDASLEDLGEQADATVVPFTAAPFTASASATAPAALPDGLTRVYRVIGHGSDLQRAVAPQRSAELRAAIAVVPFDSGGDRAHERLAIGDLIAGGVIARLSRARHVRVINRLSTQALRGRSSTVSELQQHLGATHVLSGDFAESFGRLTIRYELRDLAEDTVVRSGRLAATLADLLEQGSEPVTALAQEVHDALLEGAAQAVLSRPLPTLQSHALLLGGIQLLHRSSRHDFAASFDVLDHLARQHPRCVEPLIWQAQWYGMRAVQGLTADREAEGRAALDCIARALDAEPHNSFALAVQGFVHCVLTRDQDAAASALQQAVLLNPNESLGQLFQGMTLGLQGRLEEGIRAFGAATATSPLDPAGYIYDSIGAYLHLAAGHQAHAIALARRSLRLNREHAHSWRALTIAQAELGRLDEARASLHELLRVQPGLTQRSYLAGAGADARNRSRFAEALGRAGLPA